MKELEEREIKRQESLKKIMKEPAIKIRGNRSSSMFAVSPRSTKMRKS